MWPDTGAFVVPCNCRTGRGIHCARCNQHIYMVQDSTGRRFYVAVVDGRATCTHQT